MRLSKQRVIAAVLIGILIGIYRYHDYATWNGRGRDAFISHQLQRFDRYMLHPHFVSALITTVMAYGLFLGLYELIVAGVSKIAPDSRGNLQHFGEINR